MAPALRHALIARIADEVDLRGSDERDRKGRDEGFRLIIDQNPATLTSSRTFRECAVDVIGAVTAGAAGLAAVLAAVNLHLTGRRELHKWTREALVEALVVYLDTSIKQGGLCGAVASLGSLSDSERDRLHKAVIVVHDLQTDTLTRLRLLAPSRVIAAAQELHNAGHELMSTCFITPLQTTETRERAYSLVQNARQQFLESARSTLRLADTAVVQHIPGDAGWHEFRRQFQPCSN